MFETIVVPTDGSDCAANALEEIRDLASRHDATIHVLSVVDVRNATSAQSTDRLDRAAADLVASTVADIDDVSTVTSVRNGYPDEEIRAYANQVEADLLVMGSHGRTGVRRFVLGSVTEKVLRLGDVPVLTVTPNEENGDTERRPYDDVLITTDGSVGAAAPVEPAATIADTYDATVHVLSVVDTRALGTDVRSATLVDTLENKATTAVEDMRTDLRSHGVEQITTAVEHGTPHQAIRSYIEEADVDLVAMGTHGRTGLERYLLGSVTEKVVRTAPIPVLTVRVPADDEE